MSTQANNPYDICAWRPESACADCEIAGALKCRFNWGDLLVFMAGFVPFAIAVVAGMVRSGFGRFVWGWVGFMMFFFFVWEARVLCSHCPYWSEGRRSLTCIANYGVIKIWRYHPEPMSMAEKAQFLVGVGIMVVFPLPFLLIGQQYLLAGVALAVAIAMGLNLHWNVCSRCVNFSCPSNNVPKRVVDAYLRRNPVMRQAWEASGYRLGD